MCGAEETRIIDTAQKELIASGQCGDSLSFKLYIDGTLEIYGSGEMWDFHWTIFAPFSLRSARTAEVAPWSDYADQIQRIVIEEGVTSIGTGAFSGCSEVTDTVVLPKTVTSIGSGAFSGCSSLSRVEIPVDVEEIGDSAFAGCESLESAKIFSSDVVLGQGVFDGASDSFTISDYAGSVGQAYAAENNYGFVPLSTVSVAGQITAQNPGTGFTVKLMESGMEKYSATMDGAAGAGAFTQTFRISDVKAGKYDLVITKAGHLSYTVTDIYITEEAIDLAAHINEAISNAVLVSGDINSDGCIDLQDVALLTSENTYSKSYEDAQNKTADINGDSLYDLQDLAIITSEKNYGKSSVTVSFAEIAG